MTRVFFFLGFPSSLKQQRFFSLSAKKRKRKATIHNDTKKQNPCLLRIVFFIEELVDLRATYTEKGKRIPKGLKSGIETCDEDILAYEKSKHFHSCFCALFLSFFFFSSGKLMFDPFFVYEMPIYMQKTSKILTFKGTPNPVISSFGEQKEVQQKCFSKKKVNFFNFNCTSPTLTCVNFL